MYLEKPGTLYNELLNESIYNEFAKALMKRVKHLHQKRPVSLWIRELTLKQLLGNRFVTPRVNRGLEPETALADSCTVLSPSENWGQQVKAAPR